MKGSVIPAHRRAGLGGGGAGAAQVQQKGCSVLSSIIPNRAPQSGFSDPWAPHAGANRRQRPASAGVRRTIVDNGLSLFGQNKAASEIQSAVRGRPASAGLARSVLTPGNGALAIGTKAEDYEPIKRLGQGASGSVHLAVLKEDGSRWVLKQVELGRAGSAPSSERNSVIARTERDNVLREVKLMSSIRSENLIKYCTSFVHQSPGGPQSVFIVMEYAERGALSDHIKQLRSTASRADESFIWKCMLQISAGLAAIHAHRVIHRDIKSANILITREDDFKIADLGIAVSTSLCNVQGRMRTGRCGTQGYMAPEVSNDLPYDARADMWSLGCVLYEIACHRIPFPCGTLVDTSVHADSGISMQAIQQAADQLQLPHAYSDCLNNHVLWCMAVEASGRPSARELISTKDSIQRAVQMRITLLEGFEFPPDSREERVEYKAASPAGGKRRNGRAASARSLIPASSSWMMANEDQDWGGDAAQQAWAEDDELNLSPIQGPHASANGAIETNGMIETNGAIEIPQESRRPLSATAINSDRPATSVGGKTLAVHRRPASALPLRGRSGRKQQQTGGKSGGEHAGEDALDAWPMATGAAHVQEKGGWRTAQCLEGAGPLEVDGASEMDLPEHLRSPEQAAWEQKHSNLVKALPGWHQEAVFELGSGDAQVVDGEVQLKANAEQGGKRGKKVKKLSKNEKLVAAGAGRRMLKALHAVLAPTLYTGSIPMSKLELLLVAQVGMPLPKMLQHAGAKGHSCSLLEFLLSHPADFRVGAGGLVSLRGADVIAGERHASTSSRILSTIVKRPIG